MIFTINRELISFIIIDRYIYYSDRKIKSFIRCLPKPEKLLDKQKNLAKIFEFTEEELAEYAKCESEGDIAKSIIRDANLKGCRLVIRKDLPNPEGLINQIKDKEVIVLNELNG